MTSPAPKVVEFPDVQQHSRKRRHGALELAGVQANREKIQQERQNLPIFAVKEELKKLIEANDTVVFVSETGTGKSTQIPQFLKEWGFSNKKTGNKEIDKKEKQFSHHLIACTQPRRVAAISIAARVAVEVGTRLGEAVGYSIRFDDTTCPSTRIKYITDGMMIRETLNDPLLSNYRVICLDEAHSRTINTDLLFALLKQIQQKRKLEAEKNPEVFPLKLVLMSATLEAEKLAGFFNSAPIYSLKTRQYPVEIFYTKKPSTDYIETTLFTILQIHLEPENPGDVLVFLTGQEEILLIQSLLQEKQREIDEICRQQRQGLISYGHPSFFSYIPLKLLICPLFAALSGDSQLAVFSETPPGHRKIILSTNIAETSVTLPDIRFVVDCGFSKQRIYNHKTGFDSLLIKPISKAEASQRAGRAGRLRAGICYRLYTESDYHQLSENIIPEILRTNLIPMILQLKALKIENLLEFPFLTRPSKLSIKHGLEQLLAYQALNPRTGELNSFGSLMIQFPLFPVYSRTILSAMKREFHCTEEILSIISMLSIETLFKNQSEKKKQKQKFSHPDGLSSSSSSYEESSSSSSSSFSGSHAKKYFFSPYGDHFTLLNIYSHYHQAALKGKANEFCEEMYLNRKSMEKVEEIRHQLVEICKKQKIPLESAKDSILSGQEEAGEGNQGNSDYGMIGGGENVSERSLSGLSRSGIDLVRKALLSGFFLNLARKTGESSYSTVLDGLTVQIHPNSVLFSKKPEFILYNELIFTKKYYLRDCCVVEPEWPAQVVPHFWNSKQQEQTTPVDSTGNGAVESDGTTGKNYAGSRRLNLSEDQINRMATISDGKIGRKPSAAPAQGEFKNSGENPSNPPSTEKDFSIAPLKEPPTNIGKKSSFSSSSEAAGATAGPQGKEKKFKKNPKNDKSMMNFDPYAENFKFPGKK